MRLATSAESGRREGSRFLSLTEKVGYLAHVEGTESNNETPSCHEQLPGRDLRGPGV